MLTARETSSFMPMSDTLYHYVQFSSGTTSDLAVVYSNIKGMIHRLQWMWYNYPFNENEICLHRCSLSFVDCYWEILGPLCKGIEIVIYPENEKLFDVKEFVETIKKHHITRMTVFPLLLDVYYIIFINIYFIELECYKIYSLS